MGFIGAIVMVCLIFMIMGMVQHGGGPILFGAVTLIVGIIFVISRARRASAKRQYDAAVAAVEAHIGRKADYVYRLRASGARDRLFAAFVAERKFYIGDCEPRVDAAHFHGEEDVRNWHIDDTTFKIELLNIETPLITIPTQNEEWSNRLREIFFTMFGGRSSDGHPGGCSADKDYALPR